MDNIKTLATEWWKSKNSPGKMQLIEKHGITIADFTRIPTKHIVEMYEAEHASIREEMEPLTVSLSDVKEEDLSEFKKEWNKAMMGACTNKISMTEESRFVLSTDTYEIPTYALARVTGKSVEIMLAKSIRNKVSFEEEVNNLQKYFNAKLIK